MNDRDSIDRMGSSSKGDRHRCNFEAYQNAPFWDRDKPVNDKTDCVSHSAQDKLQKEEGEEK